jgi:hypothetical protein
MMKVKQMIEQLSKMNPEALVVIDPLGFDVARPWNVVSLKNEDDVIAVIETDGKVPEQLR